MHRYEPSGRIGRGTYGEVWRATDVQTNRIVALKRIKLLDVDEGIPGTALREISLLKDLRHSNVVDLLDVLYKNNTLTLVFEHLDQDLHKYMDTLVKERRFMEPTLVKNYLKQIIDGVAFCHEHRVQHRDLKPQNLLLDGQNNLKLADFGLARTFSVPLRQYTHEVVTLWYRAPEILLGCTEYSVAIDSWSVGCIFAEMVKLSPLFPGRSEIDELFHIFRMRGTPTEEIWPGISSLENYQSTFPMWPQRNMVQVLTQASQHPGMGDEGFDLLEQLLIFDPTSRLSCSLALNHLYFDEDSL